MSQVCDNFATLYTTDYGEPADSPPSWNDRDDGQGSELSDTLYLYDGWNLLAELNANASNAKVRTHIWGSRVFITDPI